MGNSQMSSGSQEGQAQSSGSQAGQTGSGQQGNPGSQAGQDYSGFRFEGQGEEESVPDFVSRILGDLTTARKQAATYRTRLNGEGNQQAQQSQQATQQNQNGDQSNLAAQLLTLQRELAEERETRKAEKINSQLISALASAGAVNPAKAVRLIDLSDLDIDETGAIVDPGAAVRTLKAEMPTIFTTSKGNGDGGAGNGGAGGNTSDMNSLIRRRAGMRG